MKTLEPLEDHILVRPKKDEVSKGGIILTQSTEKPVQGEVIAVGTGRVTESGGIIPMTLKIGDHVLYGKYSGLSVRVDERDVLLMRAEDVLARFK